MTLPETEKAIKMVKTENTCPQPVVTPQHEKVHPEYKLSIDILRGKSRNI